MTKRSVRRRRASARGFTMIEVLVALAITALMVGGMMSMMNSTLEDTRGQQAALYQQQLGAAAKQLIQQNYTALSAAATSTTPVVVPLVGSPYQLSTFLSANVSNTNAYRQTPCLLVYGGTGGALQGLLVTEGGTTIPDPELGYISANSGQGGGSIPSINNAGGAAKGAFGAWSVATPNPAGASCTGTKAGGGHLASEVFFNGSQAQNADFLYRVAVPGNPAANTMQVPIVLAKQYVDYSGCSTRGAIAADATGNVVNCDGTRWEPQASFHWRAPVADESSLSAVPSAMQGDVVMTNLTNRAYTYNGSAWQALAVNEAGNLDLGNTQVVGNPCTTTSPTTTPITTDAQGRVLSCQSGKWQTQSELTQNGSTTGCELIMASAGATDYSGCLGPPGANYKASPFVYNAVNGTYSYAVTVSVTLDKPGGVVATTWAHMNDGVCTTGTKPGAQAQISQSVDVIDVATNTLVSHTESQSPTLTDDSGGINNSVTQAVVAGKYNVVVTTNWATYAIINTPWTSSFCGQAGTTIPNTPVAAGWTVSSFY
ncbi:shufflon system plasmid conjugative transfer pilus tip adhesin PilV [Paraburkholderia sediminicola]|uniref:shufflon system plasmid conjugative transfer pilus tip adhesin PilV n=1 Tax=Paraburkholderia sediminicola TaxID=458836 RepID=UPI0038B9D26D